MRKMVNIDTVTVAALEEMFAASLKAGPAGQGDLIHRLFARWMALLLSSASLPFVAHRA